MRFYAGDDNCNNYTGDDWDDSPYECNAGQVYGEYIKGYIEIALDLNYCVLEPADDWQNRQGSNYSKDDMKKRLVPCIIIFKTECEDDNRFNKYVGASNTERIYFNDNIDMLKKYPIIKLEKIGIKSLE